MDWLIPLMQVTGTLLEARAQRSQGKAAQQIGQAQQGAAEFRAAQLDQVAGQSVATAQRVAQEERRQARLLASRALAVAAAGGGGASDPTVSRIIADIEGEGAYRAAVALYEGEDQARKARMGAAAERYEGQLAAVSGQNASQAGNIMAASSLLTGGASLYEKYKGASSGYTSTPGYMPTMSRRGSFSH